MKIEIAIPAETSLSPFIVARFPFVHTFLLFFSKLEIQRDITDSARKRRPRDGNGRWSSLSNVAPPSTNRRITACCRQCILILILAQASLVLRLEVQEPFDSSSFAIGRNHFTRASFTQTHPSRINNQTHPLDVVWVLCSHRVQKTGKRSPVLSKIVIDWLTNESGVWDSYSRRCWRTMSCFAWCERLSCVTFGESSPLKLICKWAFYEFVV